MLPHTNPLVKASVLSTGQDKEFRQAHLLDFKEGTTKHTDEYKAVYGDELARTASNLNIARYKRKQRVEKRISLAHKLGKLIFLTLTFRDDVIAKTTPEKRRRYVARFLKRQCPDYVANIDFGNDGKSRTFTDKNGNIRESTSREHYHALAQGEFIDLKKWRYGFAYAERVPETNDDKEKCAKYVAKLTNHAMKVNGGKPPRFIYSRGKNGEAFLLRYCSYFF